MTLTLEFDQYTDAVQAHRMIAKAKGAVRASYSSGSETVYFEDGYSIRFKISTRRDR